MIVRLLVCDLDVRYVEPQWRKSLRKLWYCYVTLPIFYLKRRSALYHKARNFIDFMVDFYNNPDFFWERIKDKTWTGYRVKWETKGNRIIRRYYNLGINDKEKGIVQRGFQAYYDNSEGVKIESTAQIKELEKQGKMYMTPDEAKKIFAQKKKERDEAWRKELRKSVEEKVIKMNQGFSYYNDLRDKGIIKE